MYSSVIYRDFLFFSSFDAVQFHGRSLPGPGRLDQDPDLGPTLVEKVFPDCYIF